MHASSRQNPQRSRGFSAGFIKRLSCWLVLSTALTIGTTRGLRAATYYWDADGSAANDNVSLGTGLGGGGAWDTSSLFWFTSPTSTDGAWPNLTTDTAVFTGTAGAVALAGGGVNAG